MKWKDKEVVEFAEEVTRKCMNSQRARLTDYAYMRQYFYSGSDTGKPALYNRCFPHIDRLASYLFSPGEVHFTIGQDSTSKEWIEPLQEAARYLSFEFHRTGVDLHFASAIDWALCKGSSFLKTTWGNDGFESTVVQPESLGVYREDINGLDRQEAFCHQTILTKTQFERLVEHHPEREKIMHKIISTKSESAEDAFNDGILSQIILGGTRPVGTAGGNSGSPTFGISQVFGGPTPDLAPDVKGDLILLNELWVKDDDRDDYTTIQYVSPGIVIEGKLKRRNLCDIKGEQPFQQVCANHTEGYFWGRSELTNLVMLQDTLNRRMNEVDRISRLRAKPPQILVGANISDQDKLAMQTPNGFVTVSQAANFQHKSIAPELPPELFEQIGQICNFFDDVGGFEAITKGQGEQGVRSGVHSETLLRTATPRLRDRALQIERQCGDVGDYCFKLLKAKIARAFKSKDGQEFLLDQLPDECRVSVDSHSSSPAFSNETKTMALELLKTGAITPTDFIRLTHPPMEDILVEKSEERAKSQQEEHKEAVEAARKDPSLWAKLFGGKKK